jgi:hypothetical protein
MADEWVEAFFWVLTKSIRREYDSKEGGDLGSGQTQVKGPEVASTKLPKKPSKIAIIGFFLWISAQAAATLIFHGIYAPTKASLCFNGLTHEIDIFMQD